MVAKMRSRIYWKGKVVWQLKNCGYEVRVPNLLAVGIASLAICVDLGAVGPGGPIAGKPFILLLGGPGADRLLCNATGECCGLYKNWVFAL